VIPKGRNEDSFKALDQSGYTGFSTSLASSSLKSALKNIKEWDYRIVEEKQPTM